MPTTFTKGDLFSAEGTRAYAHGCNLQGTMDTGVSVAFKKKWPRMFEEYAAACAAKSLRLGDVIAFRDGEQVVYSLALQEQAASKAKWPALIGALEKWSRLRRRTASTGSPSRASVPGAPGSIGRG